MRFRALDGWRGLCALAVAMFHFPVVSPARDFPLIAHGYLFVDFFFVLSGFVVARAWEARLGRPGQRWRFLVRRFGRLWPLHAAMLVIFVASALAQHHFGLNERHAPAAILTNLLLIHGLGIHKDLTWNAPSWSISVEAMLYVVFVALASFRVRVLAYAGLIVLGVAVLQSVAPSGMASTYDFGAFRGLAGFFTGVLLTRAPAIATGLSGELVALAIALAFVWFNRLTVLAPAVFGLTVYVFAHAKGPLSAALEIAPLERIGDWSYSIYMTHAAVGGVIWAFAPKLGLTSSGEHLASASAGMTLGLTGAYVAGVMVAAAITHALIEQPARRQFARWTEDPSPAA